MGDIDENTPPMCVLLPTCLETDTDVFFEILKSVILHTRLHDNFHIPSIISGMVGETFQVDTQDLSDDWKTLTSHSRQVRQSKLLGFWAARHYPLIGKKLIGASWQPHNICNVEMSELTEITEEEIDQIVSKKMKIRIIELNVCKGTLKKLNYFVRAPMSIGRDKVITLSSKMKSCDIQSEYIEECWEALKLGRFSPNFEQPMDSVATSHMPFDQHHTVRSNGDKSTAETRNYISTQLSDGLASSFQVSPCNVALTDITASTTNVTVARQQKSIPSAKRTRYVIPNRSETATVAHDKTNIDVLRSEVGEMREDIRNLTECIGSNTDSERFHLVVFKQKDSEIAHLKDSLENLEKEKRLIEDEKRKLSEEIVAKSNLISALEKGLDANSKLHEKMAEESNALTQKLSDGNQLNCKLTDTNAKLREEVNAARNHSANIAANLQDLVLKMSAADEVNVNLTKTNEKLREDFNSANNHFDDMKQNFQLQIQDLLHKSSAADRSNIELTDMNGKLQQELSAIKNHLTYTESNFQQSIQDIVNKLSAADQINIELTDKNKKLQQELDSAKIELKKNEKLSDNLNDLRARTNALINEFKTRVDGTEKVNAVLAAKNEKLQDELNFLKQNAGNDKDLLANRPETPTVQNGYDRVDLQEFHCNEVGGNSFEKTLPESVKPSGCVAVEPKNDVPNGNGTCHWDKEFVSDDAIVQQCRPVLQQQKFGWMKFHPYKSAKFCPAFVYPIDEDGVVRAQKIKADGYITDTKSPFWEFHFGCELPDDKKDSSQVVGLKKFNNKFGAHFE